MALKTSVAGQFNLVQESNAQSFLGFDLAAVFPAITGIQEQTYYERQLVAGDNEVDILKGGVNTIRGFLIQVIGNDAVTLKHDGNAAGMSISKGALIFGSFDAIKVSTAATQPVTLKILIFE